jgi:hypothetical protein
MWPGAGSGPDGRRLAAQAGLALTTLLPLSAAFPVVIPEGDGTGPVAVVMGAGGAAIPHAVMRNASRQRAALRTLSPHLRTTERVEQERTLA